MVVLWLFLIASLVLVLELLCACCLIRSFGPGRRAEYKDAGEDPEGLVFFKYQDREYTIRTWGQLPATGDTWLLRQKKSRTPTEIGEPTVLRPPKRAL